MSLESTIRFTDLAPEEMDKSVGGNVNSLPDLSDPCPESPDGKHAWKEKAVFTEFLFIRHHVQQCEHCGKARDDVMPW